MEILIRNHQEDMLKLEKDLQCCLDFQKQDSTTTYPFVLLEKISETFLFVSIKITFLANCDKLYTTLIKH